MSHGPTRLQESDLGPLREKYTRHRGLGVILEVHERGFLMYCLPGVASGRLADEASRFANRMEEKGWTWYRESPYRWLFTLREYIEAQRKDLFGHQARHRATADDLADMLNRAERRTRKDSSANATSTGGPNDATIFFRGTFS